MNKLYRTIVAVFTGAVLIGLGTGQSLAANPNQDDTTLHRDGSAFVKQSRITQADRQAAADRAKAKGFKAPRVGASAASGNNIQNKGGPKNEE